MFVSSISVMSSLFSPMVVQVQLVRLKETNKIYAMKILNKWDMLKRQEVSVLDTRLLVLEQWCSRCSEGLWIHDCNVQLHESQFSPLPSKSILLRSQNYWKKISRVQFEVCSMFAMC